MSTPKEQPAAQDERERTPDDRKPGTNAVEHEPDPSAEPIADGEHKFVPRSPYSAGNT
ncbi:hypothetical protein [Caenimonas aquaedulcis]|uniref:Uncharacterized protein n=1 Tax=Caenimonas aquaedulcis TaxID=2793270 RepID=A0A931H3D6_9BURK|nr:hypothetical protein [Caenimonas aquaedulcis]MBG9387802.1 hypothetical protein [Caenimonas aquaedulcis]